MTPPIPRDEPEHDPWLRHALRHAPDADATAPPEISDAILRSARQAVARSATTTRRPAGALVRWWDWLARPPVAAGFATLMVAVLVGLIWFDRPLEDALPARPGPPTAAPSVAPMDPSASNTAIAPPPLAADAAKKDAAPAAAKREAEVKAEAKAAGAAPPRPATPAKRERAPMAQAPAAAPPTTPTPTPTPARPAPAPAPVSVPEATPPAPTPFTDDTARATPASPAAAARADMRAERRSAESAGALAKGSAAPVAAAPAPATAQSLRAAPAASGIAIGLPWLIAPPYERWTWQRGADARALTPAVRRWIEQLNRVARWRAADGTRPVADDGVALTLLRDGAPYATFRIDADTAWYTPVDGAPSLAPLSAIEAATLRSDLLAATP